MAFQRPVLQAGGEQARQRQGTKKHDDPDRQASYRPMHVTIPLNPTPDRFSATLIWHFQGNGAREGGFSSRGLRAQRGQNLLSAQIEERILVGPDLVEDDVVASGGDVLADRLEMAVDGRPATHRPADGFG